MIAPIISLAEISTSLSTQRVVRLTRSRMFSAWKFMFDEGHRSAQPFIQYIIRCQLLKSSGDFSHGPQHVFWTCLDQIVKSKDVLLRKYRFFGRVKMKMDGLTKTKMKSIK